MKRWIPKPLIVLAKLAGLALFFLFGLVCWLHTQQAHHWIGRILNQVIPGEVSWTRSELSLPAGRFVLGDIAIRTPEGDAVVTAESLHLDISWSALLSGTPHVSRLELVRPVIRLERPAGGELNLARVFVSPGGGAPAASGEPAAPALFVDSLRVEDAMISYEETRPDAPPIRAQVKGISLVLTDVDILRWNGDLVLKLTGGDLGLPGFSADMGEVRVVARLTRDVLDVKDLTLSTGPVRLQATGRVERWAETSRTIAADVSAQGDLARLGKSLGWAFPVSGAMNLGLRVSGPLTEPVADASLTFADAVTPWIVLKSANLETSFRDRRVAVTRLSLDSDRGRLDASGEVDIRDVFPNGFAVGMETPDRLSWRLDIAGLSARLERLLAAPTPVDAPTKESKVPDKDDPPPPATGAVILSGSLSGRGVSAPVLEIRADLKATATDMAAGGWASPRLDLEAGVRYAGGIVTVEKFSAQTGKTLLTVDGRYDASGDALTAGIRLKAPDLTELLGPLAGGGVSGSLVVDATASGNMAAPEANVTLTAEKVSAGPFADGRVSLRLALDREGRLVIPDLSVQAGGTALDLTGEARLREGAGSPWSTDPAFALQVREGRIDLADLVSGARGRLALEGRLSGRVRAIAGGLHLAGQSLSVGGQSVESVSLDLTPDGGRWGLALRGDLGTGSTLTATGRVAPADQTWEAELKAPAIDIRHIAALAQSQLTGKLALTATGRGRFDAPVLSAELTTDDLRLKDKPLPGLRVSAGFTDGRVAAKAETDAHITASGTFAPASGRFSVTAGFADTDLAPWFRLAGQEELEGVFSGVLTAEGTARENPRASLAVERLEVARSGQRLLAAAVPFTAVFAENRLSLPEARLTILENGFLSVKGRAATDGGLDLTADGRIPLSVFQGMAPGLEDLSGDLGLEARVSGDVAHLRPVVELRLADAGLTVPWLGSRLEKTAGRLRITPEAVTVESLTGAVGAGGLTLSGSVALKDWSPASFDASLEAHGLAVAVPDMLDLSLGGRLRLTGPTSGARLAGKLSVLEGRYYKDVQINPLRLPQKERTIAPESDAAPHPFLAGTSLDVAVDGREPFLVENNVAMMSLKPGFRIRGTLANIRLEGRTQVVQGTVVYEKKEFEIIKGVVDFINPYRIEPDVQIEARTIIRDWTISLAISGTPDNLKLDLSSTPAEEHADILALILFDKTTSEMGAKGDGESSSLTQMAADIVAEKLQENVGKATGLDLVELKYAEGTEKDEAATVRVTVGKQLSRRLTVKYGVAAKGGSTVQLAEAEYRFLENLLMSTYKDSGGGFGGRIIYRLEFR